MMAEPLLNALSSQLVFDLGREGYRSWHIAILPLCAAGAFAAMSLLSRTKAIRGRDVGVNWYARFAGMLAGMALLGSAFLLWITWTDYQRLRVALSAGRCHVVVGTVTDFRPGDQGGHARERFRVANERFEYSESVISDAFQRTASHGGPIHEGVQVRMLVYDGAILRLEILS